MKFTLALLVALSSTAFAAPRFNEPIDQCLEISKQWIYRNMTASTGDAVRLAIDFCQGGGTTTCLDPSVQWIYRNTGRSPAQAAEVTLGFCKKGDVNCLEPAKQWIYRNSGGSPAQAAEQAIKVCSDRLSCDPGVRPIAPRVAPTCSKR